MHIWLSSNKFAIIEQFCCVLSTSFRSLSTDLVKDYVHREAKYCVVFCSLANVRDEWVYFDYSKVVPWWGVRFK
ncbi:hypothetical protein H5410_043195 [Solanum commersonii]|uniref:Uncharacterized protein n=1 Tax=Solanum commersonii TaxID=4109 RepID=A0A9J5XWW2_SOLCO|nr:hypothetical protein H5410_043195 [Solanum commersonii]